jgi:hypothetical protein
MVTVIEVGKVEWNKRIVMRRLLVSLLFQDGATVFKNDELCLKWRNKEWCTEQNWKRVNTSAARGLLKFAPLLGRRRC